MEDLARQSGGSLVANFLNGISKPVLPALGFNSDKASKVLGFQGCPQLPIVKGLPLAGQSLDIEPGIGLGLHHSGSPGPHLPLSHIMPTLPILSRTVCRAAAPYLSPQSFHLSPA